MRRIIESNDQSDGSYLVQGTKSLQNIIQGPKMGESL